MEHILASPVVKPASSSWKFIIGGILILGAILYAAAASFQSNTVYYLTLQEFSAQKAKFAGQVVRVNGPLDQASIQLDQKTMVLKFNMKDGGIVQPVVYKGVVPDTLTNGESVVAEGKLDAQGIFQANSILVKCPSKYEGENVNK